MSALAEVLQNCVGEKPSDSLTCSHSNNNGGETLNLFICVYRGGRERHKTEAEVSNILDVQQPDTMFHVYKINLVSRHVTERFPSSLCRQPLQLLNQSSGHGTEACDRAHTTKHRLYVVSSQFRFIRIDCNDKALRLYDAKLRLYVVFLRPKM
ncbi:hypothetical protein AVEN_46195-1 [Araneus ventricosus]|uniref:Uncharacterized protein n=1 Tax=Araneus ventricosus TaxID=182803 RepID=A0A4Y2E8T4_ARAVE|nr:hypothetical protein AVEN_46195-1 [Araneus ventricosus]